MNLDNFFCRSIITLSLGKAPTCQKKIQKLALALLEITILHNIHSCVPFLFQGKAVVHAAKAAGVQHMIFSSAENIKDAMGKTSKCTDGKAAIEEYIKELGNVIRKHKIIKEQGLSRAMSLNIWICVAWNPIT